MLTQDISVLKNYSKKYDFRMADTAELKEKIAGHVLYNHFLYLSVWPGQFTSFLLFNKKKRKATGIFQVMKDQQNAWSPYKAPFASFYFEEDPEFRLLTAFIEFCLEKMAEADVKKVLIKHYPDFYTGVPPDKILSAILSCGLEIVDMDINHHLELGAEFEKGLKPMQRRRIKKCRRLGFKFQSIANNDTESVFRTIQSLRSKKDIPVNMDIKEFNILLRRFPDHYKAFTVTDQGRIIAATLTVHVNDRVLYQFLPASEPAYNASSPMVFLIDGLYRYALEKQYKYIDMGISSIHGKPQPDLIRFKERLGCLTGMKFSFSKTIA